jgi:hypothetical protein
MFTARVHRYLAVSLLGISVLSKYDGQIHIRPVREALRAITELRWIRGQELSAVSLPCVLQTRRCESS